MAVQGEGKILLDNGITIPYILDRGNRKNMYIVIRGGRVILKLPYGADIAKAEDFMRGKADWILSKLSQPKDDPVPDSYNDGDVISLAGRRYRIETVESRTYFQPRFTDGKLEIAVMSGAQPDGERFSQLAQKAVIQKAVEIIFERMRELSSLTGLIPKKVTVKRLTGSWGNCSSLGNISINVNVVFYPAECLDYVIIHELCDRRHMDHSKDFWRLVESFCPDWKRIRAILR